MGRATFPVTSRMKLIGFQYNRSPLDRSKRRSPSVVNRVTLIDAYLRESGFRLFIYSPSHIVTGDETVPGYLVENGSFAETRAPIPAVNGNWTHRTRRLLDEGMGFREFSLWAEKRGMGIYVPHAFSELLGNKHETYKLVRGFHESLHPHCEAYTGSERQLEHFVEAGPLTFLKPRTGSKGDRIITVRRDGPDLSVTYYNGGERKDRTTASLSDASKFVQGLIAQEDRKYVIQHGVETMRHEGSTFDIRVTMLNDGEQWHWLHEVRLSRAGSDVSNVKQGGRTVVTEELLFDLLGTDGAQQILYELKSESFGLAAYLERLHPGDILEVAFDFVIDREGRLHLL